MLKILSIVGPTATGKTSFALWLAEKLVTDQRVAGVDLISADSRQVYQELPIISGADIPMDLHPKIKIYGVAIIGVEDDWSVAHFRQFALPLIEKSLAEGRLPIIVGGTGLYHRHLFNPELDDQPGPDLQLRKELADKSVVELQTVLGQLSPSRLEAMNDSDRHNPRRLVRAIEQARHDGDRPTTNIDTIPVDFEQLTIGLTDTLENIEQKIKLRVEERWQQGAIEEVKNLKEKAISDFPALTSTGVKEILQYLDGQLTEEQTKTAWALREFQYAKRQLTWWKKEPEIHWYDVSEKGWNLQARQLMYSQIT
ncbi:MAG TPA: tRNA (adenosine(37)-N6)-dimethylallyltransferase MiaA [Patescibacteria group bacterium]